MTTPSHPPPWVCMSAAAATDHNGQSRADQKGCNPNLESQEWPKSHSSRPFNWKAVRKFVIILGNFQRRTKDGNCLNCTKRNSKVQVTCFLPKRVMRSRDLWTGTGNGGSLSSCLCGLGSGKVWFLIWFVTPGKANRNVSESFFPKDLWQIQSRSS